eukprot:scaffold17460_cov128-Isochrysis_galbana.AAC.12
MPKLTAATKQVRHRDDRRRRIAPRHPDRERSECEMSVTFNPMSAAADSRTKAGSQPVVAFTPESSDDQ